MANDPVLSEGTLGEEPTTIYEVRSPNIVEISNIKFTNVLAPYTLQVFFSQGNSQSLLYQYDLDMGDVVIDDTPYKLGYGMSLVAQSNIADRVNFVVNGIEKPVQ